VKREWGIRYVVGLAVLAGVAFGGCLPEEAPDGANDDGSSTGIVTAGSSPASTSTSTQPTDTGTDDAPIEELGDGPGTRLDVGQGSAAEGSAEGPSDCAGEIQTAERTPLDMYIMLDASASMLEDTGQAGVTKWSAISQALTDFIGDPGSEEIGIGLQYFPLHAAGVPETCTTNAECGDYGPCFVGTCFDGSGSILPCADDADCGGYECVRLGECRLSGGLCAPAEGQSCSGSVLDLCVPLDINYCVEESSCETTDYSTPEVPLAALPENESALVTAIAAKAPDGDTPTAPALTGAIDYAAAWASSHPDRTVVVVLATDGIPTACDPTDAAGIGAVAASALAASPSVPTFVIGIISEVEGQVLLDEVAAAGGTEQAFLLDPQSLDLGQAFRTALDEIRGSALSCEYLIPEPSGNVALDLGRVNLEHTPDGGVAQTIPYVGSQASCTAEGGWYYNVDPAVGDPTSILVCASTCERFGQGGAVEIRVGCETVLPVG